MTERSQPGGPAGMSLPCLAIGVAAMVAVTAYPRLAADGAGHASHTLAMLLFSAMSVGFIRGVGFVPENRWLRHAFSASACYALTASWIAARLSISV